MQDKFTLEDLMIRVMPGGFLLATIFFIFFNEKWVNVTQNIDFLYTFFFFCSAFIVGELLQTLAHELEWIINIFFKFRKPSKIFLYKNNPVLNNENKRLELLEYLKLPKDEIKIFNKKYSEIPTIFWKKRDHDSLSQSIFRRIYSQVSDKEEIKISNRNYLFVRVIMIDFLLLSIMLIGKHPNIWFVAFMIFLLFLWRSRGIARWLVFKTVLLNLKK